MKNEMHVVASDVQPALAMMDANGIPTADSARRLEMARRWKSLMTEPCPSGWYRRQWLNTKADSINDLLSMIG